MRLAMIGASAQTVPFRSPSIVTEMGQRAVWMVWMVRPSAVRVWPLVLVVWLMSCPSLRGAQHGGWRGETSDRGAGADRADRIETTTAEARHRCEGGSRGFRLRVEIEQAGIVVPACPVLAHRVAELPGLAR